MYIFGNYWSVQLAVDKRLPVIVDIGSDSSVHVLVIIWH